MIYRFSYCFLILVLLCPMAHASPSQRPIVTDSRIKTLVYNENEVFQLITHYGFQSHIEFAKNEAIETISLGDSTGWQLTPEGRRLFIKTFAADTKTNMTVVTNKRTYQFDLIAKPVKDTLSKDLAYVVRFYYPDSSWNIGKPAVDNDSLSGLIPQVTGAFNFDYTFTGPPMRAPAKAFDDGNVTYIQLPAGLAIAPDIYIVQPDGSEIAVNYRVQGEYIIIEYVAEQFILRYSDSYVCLYNETSRMPVRYE